MNTEPITPIITNTERVNDIPLLLVQMNKINLAAHLNKHFVTHGNWKGLSLGLTTMGWLAHILSECSHRLNHVETWAGGMLRTLRFGLGDQRVRSLDFNDDTLAIPSPKS
jgi:hypothetical protein